MNITMITGACGGLGKGFSTVYGELGHNLLLVDINESKLKECKDDLEKRYGIIVDTISADLSDINECKKVFNYTVSKDYFVDYLVNGAGFGDQKDFKDMDIEFQLKMNHVNCDAVLYFTRVFLDNMLKHNEGHIINISSIAELIISFVSSSMVISFCPAQKS